MESDKKKSGDKKPKTVKFAIPENSGTSKKKQDEAKKRPSTAYRVRSVHTISKVADDCKPIPSGTLTDFSKRQKVSSSKQTKDMRKLSSMPISVSATTYGGISVASTSKATDDGTPIAPGWSSMPAGMKPTVKKPAEKKPASIPKAKQSP